MTPLPAGLLQQLGRRKLVVRRANPTLGVGERRSKTLGPGMEFAEHRPYQPGDDIRHLDPYLQARLGQPFIKQYAMYQQLSVTVVLDASASMGLGAKFDFAAQVAAGLAYTALAGGDQVTLATFAQGRLSWSNTLRGINGYPTVAAWLARQQAGGTTALDRLPRLLAPRLRKGGLLVVVSDFMAAEALASLEGLQAMGLEVVGVQVLAPQEWEPEQLGQGGVRLADSETAEALELTLDPATLAAYRELLQDWNRQLRERLLRAQGLYFATRPDYPLETLFLRDFQTGGLLR